MIPRHEVTDALLAMLRAVGDAQVPVVPVGDHGHPPDMAGTVTRYAIVELIPGSAVEASQGVAELGAWLRYRIRAVGRDPVKPTSPGGMARREAEFCAGVFRQAILDPTLTVAGVSWQVGSRRAESNGGVEVEGSVANQIDDYELWVTTTPTP